MIRVGTSTDIKAALHQLQSCWQAIRHHKTPLVAGLCGVVPGDGSVLTSTDCPAFPILGVVLLSARRHQAPQRPDQ